MGMNVSSNTSRLKGFAAAHFALSVLCYIAVTSSGELFYMGPIMVMAVGVIFMVLYFPAGMLMGTVAPRSRVSTLRELGVAVATQAGIAWIWAGLVLGAVYEPEPSPLLWLILPTLVLAAPSSCFVPWAIWFLAEVFQVSAGFPVWLAAALLAGLLPPLLYNLGNFCVGRNVRPYADLQDPPEVPSGRELP